MNAPTGLLLRTALLLAGGALAGWLVNLARPGGLRPQEFVLETTCSEGAVAAAPAVTSGPLATSSTAVRVLSAAHAARLCGDPAVLVADVRTPERFAEGHVADAVHLPCAASGDLLSRALSAASGKRTIVVYGEGTSDATAVASSLRHRLGRRDVDVVVLEGGFRAWSSEGLACSSGPCPDCGVHARTRP